MKLADAKKPVDQLFLHPNKPMIQADIARAEALLRSGRAFLFQALQALWDQVHTGEPPSLRQRALVKIACWSATQACAQAVDLMYAAAGGTALYEANRFERCFRDVHAATQHFALANANVELVGRVFLGLDPGTDRF